VGFEGGDRLVVGLHRRDDLRSLGIEVLGPRTDTRAAEFDQSEAPTGWTPRAKAVSASPHPRATTLCGSAGTSTDPNFVSTLGPDVSDDSESPPPQPARTRREARIGASIR